MPFDPNDRARVGVQCARKVLFLVLTGRRNGLLTADLSPTEPDLRIEVDVDFIRIEDRLTPVARTDGLFDGRHPLGFARVALEEKRSRSAPPNSHLGQKPSNRRRVNVDAELIVYLEREELGTPTSPKVVILLWSLPDQLSQQLNDWFGDRRRRTPSWQGLQAINLVVRKPRYPPVHRRPGRRHQARHFGGPSALRKAHNGENSTNLLRVMRLDNDSLETPSPSAVKVAYTYAHRVTSSDLRMFGD